MTIINNLVLGLFAKSNFHSLPSARRHYAAHPEEALRLLL
jgi:hypothetical protein